ncbi:MAG: hypothetical protein GX834_02980 [Clostridiaceae bacterium]|nr:hypothetical protein [Clostridiaceae bacterium]
MLLDIVIIVILIVCIVNGARRGLLYTLARFVIFLLSSIMSFLLVHPLSSWLIDQGVFAGQRESLAAGIESQGDIIITEVLDSLRLPEIWVRHLSDRISGEELVPAESIAQTLIGLAVSALVFFVIFMLINFILNRIAGKLTKLLNNIFLIGFLNRLGGVIISLLFSIVIIVLALFVLSALTPLVHLFGIWQEGSYIASFLREKNYFLDLLKTVF